MTIACNTPGIFINHSMDAWAQLWLRRLSGLSTSGKVCSSIPVVCMSKQSWARLRCPQLVHWRVSISALVTSGCCVYLVNPINLFSHLSDLFLMLIGC